MENIKENKSERGLKITIVLLLVSLIVFLGGFVIYVSVKFANYAYDEEIETIAKYLDCDLGYIKKENNHYVRMEHNGNEPIYVCFDEYFTIEEKETAIESLDYVFGIVGKINNNYKYKIVETEEFNSKFAKTKIYYSIGSTKYVDGNKNLVVDGYITSSNNILSVLMSKPTMNNFTININTDIIKGRKNQLKYTLTHELLHAFGFDDVYNFNGFSTTTKYYGNTYINSSFKAEMLTPNDVKCLISLYANRNSNKEEVQSLLTAYTDLYYDNFSNNCINKCGKVKDFDDQDFAFKSEIKINDTTSGVTGYIYESVINDAKYEFNILNRATNELLDSCSGKVLYKNGVAILRDVNLKLGLRPCSETESYSGGFVQDFVVGHLDIVESNILMYDITSRYTLKVQEVQ